MDPQLEAARYDKIKAAAKRLDEQRMLRYDPRSGNLAATDLGRTASHFYIRSASIETFNRMNMGASAMSDDDALNILCHASFGVSPSFGSQGCFRSAFSPVGQACQGRPLQDHVGRRQ